MHRESVAFFGGDEMERQIADGTLTELTEHMRLTRHATAKYRMVAHCITKDGGYTHVVSLSDLASMQMRMSIAASGSAGAANVEYVSRVTGSTFQAFSKLFTLYETMSSLQGNISRIYELLEAVSNTTPPPQTAPGKDIVIDQVSVMTPGVLEDSVCLADTISLRVQPRQSIIITGASGTGKSSLFRVLAGLWPLWPGCGRVECPKDVMLVPQRPYFVLGNLRDQVTYPEHVVDPDEATQRRLLEALDLAGISSMPEHYKGWETVTPWEDKLSGGEQQRLCLARVFYHRPTFVILDECTDAVNVEAEEKLYTALDSVGVTCITISKRLALPELHAWELQLGIGSKGWQLRPLLEKGAGLDEEFSQMFDVFDIDGDGELDVNELVSRIAEFKQSTRVNADKIKKVWDANGDGKVTREEFHERLSRAGVANPELLDHLRAMSRAKEQETARAKQAAAEREVAEAGMERGEVVMATDEEAARDKASELFTKADKHEIGVLSHTEVKQIVKSHPEVREEFGIGSWKQFFGEVDSDGDGTVSAQEFIRYCVSHRSPTPSPSKGARE
eukprot:TRINITY_DN15144_c0_g1_i3.p1 TRINITY_DN15144_c0_g1~~TRINITY_DN15144_c0_g1_i3.p1  ORF type:complete len:561 (+),score=147.81 TRINITY_DN15144_c0_g1_i3:290-1972(+)